MHESFVWVQGTINNREIAIGTWIALVFVFLAIHPKTNSALNELLPAIFNRKILSLFASLAVYTFCMIMILKSIGLWKTDQIVASIVWYFVSGLALLSGVFGIKENDRYFRKLFWECFSLIGVVEFITVAYSFNIIIEFILVPVYVFLAYLLVIAQRDEKNAKIKSLIEWLLALFVVYLFIKSISQIQSNPVGFFTTSTGRSFIMPALLTIFAMPFLYALYCYSSFENVRRALNLKTFQSDELNNYARKRFFRRFFGVLCFLKEQ